MMRSLYLITSGGVFILLWMGFLFLWSIPLLAAESAIGSVLIQWALIAALTIWLAPRLARRLRAETGSPKN